MKGHYMQIWRNVSEGILNLKFIFTKTSHNLNIIAIDFLEFVFKWPNFRQN
jgi:hypothetical protein